jgi:hypothetical protein
MVMAMATLPIFPIPIVPESAIALAKEINIAKNVITK